MCSRDQQEADRRQSNSSCHALRYSHQYSKWHTNATSRRVHDVLSTQAQHPQTPASKTHTDTKDTTPTLHHALAMEQYRALYLSQRRPSSMFRHHNEVRDMTDTRIDQPRTYTRADHSSSHHLQHTPVDHGDHRWSINSGVNHPRRPHRCLHEADPPSCNKTTTDLRVHKRARETKTTTSLRLLPRSLERWSTKNSIR